MNEWGNNRQNFISRLTFVMLSLSAMNAYRWCLFPCDEVQIAADFVR
jgi:hypothetical protein